MKVHENQQQFLDPIAYDLENSLDEEGEFFVQLATRWGGPVLDVACGTGRLSFPIAHAGLRVVGIDISEPLLAAARQRARNEPPRSTSSSSPPTADRSSSTNGFGSR